MGLSGRLKNGLKKARDILRTDARDLFRVGDRTKRLGSATAFALAIFVVYRWWYYIDVYSVNLLVWDQWDLYDAFFEPHGWLDLFRWQHGPHRQGAGFYITKIVGDVSGWNTRWESFAIGGIVFLTMLVALILKKRVTHSLQASDVAIVLMFLTPLQWSIFAAVPNPSHGAVPLLLLMVYCLGWTLKRPAPRYAVVLTLNMLLIFTGFGVVVGIITPVILTVEVLAARKCRGRHPLWAPLSRLVISLVSAATFFIGYRAMPGVPGFHFPVNEPWQYPLYVMMMLANFWGVKGPGIAAFLTGGTTLIIMLATCGFHFWHIHRQSGEGETLSGKSGVHRVVVVLTAFTLLFCVLTAVGRVVLGLNSAQASRYVTYLIPGFFGIYLYLASEPLPRVRPGLLMGFTVALIAAVFPLRSVDHETMSWIHSSKLLWKAAYLATGDIEESNRRAQFKVYPDAERTDLSRKLLYLKTHGLNLFLDAREEKAKQGANHDG